MPTVADVLVDGLRRAGVSRIFGVPGGGSNLELLEVARTAGLPFVLCHQESAACIMAAVTGELTGVPGAVLSTLGPGVSASVTGLAHAFLDRSPVIYLSYRHPASALGYTTHQAFDHAAMLAPVVKGSVTVSADSASHWIAHAGAERGEHRAGRSRELAGDRGHDARRALVVAKHERQLGRPRRLEDLQIGAAAGHAEDSRYTGSVQPVDEDVGDGGHQDTGRVGVAVAVAVTTALEPCPCRFTGSTSYTATRS